MPETLTKEMRCKNINTRTREVCDAVYGTTDSIDLFIKGEKVNPRPLAMSYNCPVCNGIVRFEAKGYKKQLQFQQK
jgi:hypothetical protein